MRLLVVEDERRLAQRLARGLREEGFAVDTAPTLAVIEHLVGELERVLQVPAKDALRQLVQTGPQALEASPILAMTMPGRPLKRDWLHCNSMDYNAESGHIVINSVQGELYVIDHDGTFIAADMASSVV